MNLNAWTESGHDATRLKRLGVGYGVGALSLAAVLTFVTLSAAGRDAADNEEALEVALAAAPEPPAPEPEQEPEPEAEPQPQPEPDAPPAASRPGPMALANPTAIPENEPAEVDAGASSLAGDGEDPYAGVKEHGDGSSGTTRSAPKVQPKPEPQPEPRPAPRRRGPQRLTKDMTPPVALAQGGPSYPSAAKSAGIEGTVIVTYTILEDGSVTDVRAVRGPEELKAACIAAVRRWRFKPAMLDDRPVSVRRTARFPFRITT